MRARDRREEASRGQIRGGTSQAPVSAWDLSPMAIWPSSQIKAVSDAFLSGFNFLLYFHTILYAYLTKELQSPLL